MLLTDALVFPHPESNLDHDILAVGGDLSIDRLLLAYRYGIFPWYGEEDPILWWSPRMRCVIRPAEVKVSKSMRNVINQDKYRVTIDLDFASVIASCANVHRPGQEGSWLSPEMEYAYTELHHLGYAHSVEVWNHQDQLVGGLYGVAIGRCFVGESMFSKTNNASKYGFIKLCKHLDRLGYEYIDGQYSNPHLLSLGFKEIPRSQYLQFLRSNLWEDGII